MMRANILVPLKRKLNDADGPVERMRPRFERFTKYWPITLKSTMIFNVRSVITVYFEFCFCEQANETTS